VGLRRSATFGLWEPLAGAADLHPEHLLSPSPTICERLSAWRARLAECAGASFEAGVERFSDEDPAQLPREARLVFVFRSDASKDGARMPGLGGCLGGKGWRYPDAAPLSAAELELPIAVTEFVAFYGQVEAFGDEVPEEALVMAEVDALATAQSLTEDAAQSDLMQTVFLALQQLPQVSGEQHQLLALTALRSEIVHKIRSGVLPASNPVMPEGVKYARISFETPLERKSLNGVRMFLCDIGVIYRAMVDKDVT
jgi:hypothetical protein